MVFCAITIGRFLGSEQDILRLDVSMDDLGTRMQPFQAADQLPCKRKPLGHAEDRIKHRFGRERLSRRGGLIAYICRETERECR